MKRLHNILLLLTLFNISNSLKAQQFSNISLSNVGIINSATLDFSPAFYKDGLVFVSSNSVKGKTKTFDSRINKQAMSIFIAHKDDKGQLQVPEPFSLDLVSTLHEGPLTFDRQNEVVFFSRNDSKKSGERGDEKANYVNGFAHMKIYTAHRTTGSWTEAEEMSINDDKSDACHPSISADGLRLYFSSNRPGGYGGMDMYMSENVYGKWSKPINLGPKINSPKNEVFPYIHESGVLFFSSDDMGGKGGLDIFYTNLDKNGLYESPKNIGAPFNSESDDFGFIIDKDNKSGYITSSRTGGKGEDDIYAFAAPDGLTFLPKTMQPLADKTDEVFRSMTVYAVDRKTGNPLSNIAIELAPTAPNGKVGVFNTDEKGKASLRLSSKKNYTVKSNGINYNTSEITILNSDFREELILLLDPAGTVNESKQQQNVQPIVQQNTEQSTQQNTQRSAAVQLESNPQNVSLKKNNDKTSAELLKNNSKTNGDLIKNKEETPNSNQEFTIHSISNIYYDYNDFRIRQDAVPVLDSLVNILKLHPELQAELASHADCSGSSKFNDLLSKHRASSVAKYLLSKGVSSKQLISNSYGERLPTNECADFVICPAEKHQSNRRTEIKLIKTNTKKASNAPMSTKE